MANNILQLTKKFDSTIPPKRAYEVSLYESKNFYLSHVDELIEDLNNVYKYWQTQQDINNLALVSAYCYSVVSKSNRIQSLFKFGGKSANELLVGARFRDNNNECGHLFTYCFDKENIKVAIERLNIFEIIFKQLFGDSVSKLILNETKKTISKEYFNNKGMVKTDFFHMVQELSYIEKFDVYLCKDDIQGTATVTFFETGLKLDSILKKLGIRISENNISDNTALLDEKDFNILKNKAGYLISMSLTDFSELDNTIETNYKKASIDELKFKLPKPNNEPYIGVIDTLFSKDAYFSEWVEYTQLFNSKDIPIEDEDYAHGTAVTSLIVDLPSLNPDLDDGCGRFRVKHFGICLKHGGVSTFRMMKQIQEIVEANPDVHVWNLSLGSNEAVNVNFISPEAFILDKLQVSFPDTIFVISGTNLQPTDSKPKKIGSPADSINSVVVNSVKKKTLEPTSYSRCGPVLSFFIKPDLSYYGGDADDPIIVSYPYATWEAWGTSFAAPLVARKLAYMIDILKIPRDCAKALLIDSCVGWNRNFDLQDSPYIGRGVVPISIQDIVTTPPDEMRIFISGMSEQFLTYEYNFPVPLNRDNKYPYFARATLCYFSNCNRNQGVDYTDTELNLKFGRTIENKKKNERNVKSIVDDVQNKEGYFTRENKARALYRKWDNIKLLAETYKSGGRARMRYDRDNWGIEITYTERETKDKHPVRWGLVISLKSMDGVNRFDEFKQKCQLNNWIVNEINIQNKITAYIKSNVDIEWD